jgi:hypothetical protein
MAGHSAEIAVDAQPASNPLDAIPNQMPFDVFYGPPISLDRAQAVIAAAVAEAKNRNWKMSVAVADRQLHLGRLCPKLRPRRHRQPRLWLLPIQYPLQRVLHVDDDAHLGRW